jgi:hypothetical protein
MASEPARPLLRGRGRRKKEKGKEKRKTEKEIEELGLGLPGSSASPSAADPVDLRVARVDPATARRRVVGTETSSATRPREERLAAVSGERPRRGAPLRHSTAARSPNGERARRRGPRAAPPARSLRRRSGARSRRCGASEREGESEMARVTPARAGERFCSAVNHARPSDPDERLTLTGPTSSPGGFRLSRPRPRLWPGARDARSASGPRAGFFVSGCTAACGGERDPERAGRGPNSASGCFPGGRAR